LDGNFPFVGGFLCGVLPPAPPPNKGGLWQPAFSSLSRSFLSTWLKVDFSGHKTSPDMFFFYGGSDTQFLSKHRGGGFLPHLWCFGFCPKNLPIDFLIKIGYLFGFTLIPKFFFFPKKTPLPKNNKTVQGGGRCVFPLLTGREPIKVFTKPFLGGPSTWGFVFSLFFSVDFPLAIRRGGLGGVPPAGGFNTVFPFFAQKNTPFPVA